MWKYRCFIHGWVRLRHVTELTIVSSELPHTLRLYADLIIAKWLSEVNKRIHTRIGKLKASHSCSTHLGKVFGKLEMWTKDSIKNFHEGIP